MNIQLILYLILLGVVNISWSLSIANTETYWRSLPRVDFSLADAQKTDVSYTLFTNSSPTIGTTVTEGTSNASIKNKNIPTILIIHGWATDDTSPWYRPLRDEYFKQGLYNIIFVNWSKAGNKSYEVASANCKPVGRFVAEFLITSKVDLSKVHLVGHSLGSQLTAFIGKSTVELTGTMIGRITALDPAGPMWNKPDMLDTEKLTWRDADFVDIIQTFGLKKPIGHVDFYPNRSKHQPGCPSEGYTSDLCNHARSTLFFIESVGTKARAVEGLFYEDENAVVTIKPKENGKIIVFGQHVSKHARGVYYLTTNPNKPFLK
ncbi:lipase member H-A-like [Diabrotica virgifera virgifera]|uniref:Lipase domain-containing protein n=1 Tax=Diabrotica virgifera virgifera TaxID=50390 RepID=A0ABM5IRZ7_DIAVI|nr:lipase member H-A-like [Diabrotica virgifera virgifera]